MTRRAERAGPANTGPTKAGPSKAGTSRRSVLWAGAGSVAALYPASGCSFFEIGPEDDDTDAPNADPSARESPMLTELVDAGDLPPLQDRIPATPLVIQPFDEVGTYGGTIRTGKPDPNNNGLSDLSTAGLVEWTKTNPPEVTEAMAESYEVRDDGRVYVFQLREGLRWSDGEPFTSEDIMFWYEEVMLNEELTPSFPVWLVAGGEPVVVSAEGELSVTFEFAEPYGMFLRHLCLPADAGQMWHPKHYLSAFLPSTAGQEEAERLASEAGMDNWVDYFADRNDQWRNPDRPIMGGWKITRPPMTGEAAEAERNPFFWKVDPDGRQLPYVDRVHWTFLEEEPFALRAANGDIDLATVEVGYDNAPYLIRNSEDNGFRLLRWRLDGSYNSLQVNQSHPDPVLRELYQSLDFRRGLSHAINREEVNQALLAGQGLIRHPCGTEGDPYFEEDMGQRYLEFDVPLADQLLDRAGLSERDDDGYRLRPDGAELILSALTFPAGNALADVAVLEFVERYFDEVGIRLRVHNVTQERFYDEAPMGEYDLCAYSAAGYLWDIDPLWYVPISELTYWAPLYGSHYMTHGDRGIEPEGIYQELIDIYEEFRGTVDEDERLRLGRRILRIHDENMWIIGVARIPFQPVVVSADLANVREEAVSSWRTGLPAATEPVQLFYRDEQ